MSEDFNSLKKKPFSRPAQNILPRRSFYNRRLLVILSVLLLMVSFSSVAINSNLLELLSQKQAEIFLMQAAGRREENGEITNPNFALYFPEEIVAKKGEVFSAPLYLFTKEPVESFTAYISFNPQIITASKISPANNFSRYPDVFYDNNQGLIRLTAETDEAFQGEEKVAEIEFFAQKSGISKLYFSSNQQGNISHILQKGLNVIEAVGDADVVVGD